MVLIVLALLIALTGCGREEEKLSIDAALQASVDRYFAVAPRAGRYDRLRSVAVAATTGGKAAECEHNEYFSWVIRVRPGVALGHEQNYLDAIVAHELEHCVFFRAHEAGENRLMYHAVRHNDEYWAAALEQEISRLH